MSDMFRVALIIEHDESRDRGIVRGIMDYARVHGPWRVYTSQGRAGLPLGPLEQWDGDGIIARIRSQEDLDCLAGGDLPVVDTIGLYRDPRVPLVLSDNRAVGRQAAEHLIDLGFRRYGCFDDPPWEYARTRCEAFERTVRQAGFDCSVFNRIPDSQWRVEQGRLKQWLRTLAPPVGVFACNDSFAWRVTEACHEIGLQVPEQLAVVGVDNDEMVCAFSTPPLSSVALDSVRIGYQAADVLQRRMTERGSFKNLTEVPPLGVVTRRSSEFLAIEDDAVARAVRYIRDHLAEPIQVESILDHVPMSRRSLEMRFRQALGRTPAVEIRRARLAKARELLISTEMDMPAVAAACGFATAKQFSDTFRREVGTPPSQFRRDHRA